MQKKMCRLVGLVLSIGVTISFLNGCGNQGLESSTNNTSAEGIFVSDVNEINKEIDQQETEFEELNRSEDPKSSSPDNIQVQNMDGASSTVVEDIHSIADRDTIVRSVDVSASTEVADKTGAKNEIEDNQIETYNNCKPLTDENDGIMTETQRNSLNMLNFLTVLTQEINDSKGSRLYIENAYSSLINNTYPNAVDSRTQAQITNILDTLESYRMVDVKRERLNYIYDQNRAQAMRQAIPSPVSVLNVVQSRDFLKAVASVVYMTIDADTSYELYSSQIDLQYLQDGWELDDDEAEELHNSRKQAFTYMLSMVRDNEIPGDYALSEEAVQEFVKWKNKTNVVSRISFLEDNEKTYEAFGTYWLVLAESYYESNEYQKCLDAIAKYRNLYSHSRIFRKDYDFARVLPIGILSAKEVCEKEEYIKIAENYSKTIIENADNNDWTLSYFVAQVYLDLYAQTEDERYLQSAYKLSYNNMNYLVDEQKEFNRNYLEDIAIVDVPEDSTKRMKKEIKQYNKMLKVERKTELPPVNEALYLNCDLLFALADKLNISSEEKEKVNSILHENGDSIFLNKVIDNRFWFNKTTDINSEDVDVVFKGDEFILPATYMSTRSSIKITIINGENREVFDDWTIKKVTRKEKSEYTEFTALYQCKSAQKFKYEDGMEIIIEIIPIIEEPEETITFKYKAIGSKKLFIFRNIEFERI